MASFSNSSPEMSAAAGADSPDSPSAKYQTIEEVLEDLSSRFILNLPDEELASLERVCFQVEQAHWFYEDFIREENPRFPSLALKRFSEMLFHACPLLHQWSHDHEQAFNTFMQYKTRVPVCGAIMLNDSWDKCILVKGWKASSGWGFPKGKINQDEEPHKCAAREVLEETGYDLAGQINKLDVIEMSIKEQKISLYIVQGVPEDYPFKTKTRKEISKIEWFKLVDLPTWRRNKAVPGKFYLISPFIGALKTFINERRPKMGVRRPAKFKNEIVPHPHLISDRTQDHHQESSSSSSADNGGPQTPSPLCQESVVAHIVDENAHHDDPRVPPPVLAEKAIDPHFARLLNSLSISAQMADGKDLAPTALVTTVIPVPSSTTPVPASASSTTSLPASATSTDRADWSTQVPPRISDRSKISTPPSVKLGQPTGSSPKSTSENFPPASSVRPSQPTPAPSTRNQRSTPLDSLPIPPSTSPSAAEAASTARPSVSRKGSSATADISPYLSKPTELPVSGKRLKQLALLESVADESARMTPVLGQRFLPLNASFGNMSMDPRSGGYPGPCMSVPPPPMTSFNGGLGDSRVIYSSNPNIGYLPGPSARMPAPMHVPPPVPPSSVYDDPFQVRPRTSAAFHPSHLGHGNPRMSMNERQLLTLLSGPPFYAPAPSAPSNPTGFARSMHPSAIPPPPQFPSMDHPPQMPMSHVGPMPPLRIEPSRMLPSSMSSAPLSAPIRPGGFDMFAQTVPRSATNNVQLLSILNSAGAPPAGSPAPVPPPGILHR